MERENKNPELDEMMKTKLNLEDKDAKKDENDVETWISMNFSMNFYDRDELFLLRILQTLNYRS